MQDQSNKTHSSDRKPYAAPRLYALDHRATESGAPGLNTDSNELTVNINVTSSSAPS